ncbi:FAD-dependent oxidoreductase [Rhizobium sullae]|uniref:FAD/FMN-containing dehydrogenase n=1 Tax=Rhizobium sullae TaxID=50338 RepID=A0A4R3PVY3_RHISU|nr:FAD-binding oxidoreductase [Rhizobium sullae]TCU05371.1 FAD/FMN-containing dehydrogenase [Rhizobium sullae]
MTKANLAQMTKRRTSTAIKRRDLLLAGASLTTGLLPLPPARSETDPNEPPWAALAGELEGRFFRPEWPLERCLAGAGGENCASFFASARNPYFLGDNPAFTQTMGWADAWVSQPSDRVLEAVSAADIAAAVRFARDHKVRLVVKGGGHSYTGGSNAPNSLLIWTRRMNAIELHDAFTPAGSDAEPVPSVSVGAGAMWGEIYRHVCAGAGRYVQGGGCLTVGVAGLIQSGGFGSLSKAFGTAAASLLEAEVVTAEGAIRVVNAVQDPDLFFALKGGGGGTFGVVTRVTLRTHDMPPTIGAVFADISASSDEAYRALIGQMLQFYAEDLQNPTWGEQIGFRPDNALRISMLCQGLSHEQAEKAWAPFFAWLRERPDDYSLSEPPIIVVNGRQFWDPDFLKTLPGIVLTDNQAGADQDRIYWAGNREESGQFLHAFSSAWIPGVSLAPASREALVAGLFEASRHWSITLHTNKGLAGAPDDVRVHVRAETATNPVVTDSFALVICGAEGPSAYPGVRDFEPDVGLARRQAERVRSAMAALKARVPAKGSYVAEADYFEAEWEDAFWGEHYARLQKAKATYDPDNLFRVHHGVLATI